MADRSRLKKMLGMLGSAHEGERMNALSAADKELSAAGMSWTDLACLAEKLEPPDADRQAIFAFLVIDRLAVSLSNTWVMADGEARFCRDIMGQCEGGVVRASAADLNRAIEICDAARRKSNAFAPGARRIA